MYVYGKNVTKEVLNSNYKIYEAFLIKEFNDKNILEKIKNKNIKIKYLDKKDFSRFNFSNTQGVVLNVEEIRKIPLKEFLNNKKDKSLVLILDHIEDPHNFGAIIRSAESISVDAIIIPKNRSVSINETVVKTSVGTCFYMNFIESNLHQAILELKEYGYQIIASDMDGEDYNKINYEDNVALILGSEGSGVSHLLKQNSDVIAKIPMTGKVNSLNVSVATGIMIYKINETKMR